MFGAEVVGGMSMLFFAASAMDIPCCGLHSDLQRGVPIMLSCVRHRTTPLSSRRPRQGLQQEEACGPPVCCSTLILIMVSLGMGRGLSQGYTGSRPRPWPK